MLKKFATSELLLDVLDKLMRLESLSAFRLVGGTALSLLLGHRISEDIDLFAFKPYGSIPFKKIELELVEIFQVVINTDTNIKGFESFENNYGLHLFVGKTKEELVKVDILNWSDDFHEPAIVHGGIRLATLKEIASMKLDVISRGGRKKDFWDLSELLDLFSMGELLSFYREKYPYYDDDLVIKGLTDFSNADVMPDPICFKGKHWEVIRQEMRY